MLCCRPWKYSVGRLIDFFFLSDLRLSIGHSHRLWMGWASVSESREAKHEKHFSSEDDYCEDDDHEGNDGDNDAFLACLVTRVWCTVQSHLEQSPESESSTSCEVWELLPFIWEITIVESRTLIMRQIAAKSRSRERQKSNSHLPHNRAIDRKNQSTSHLLLKMYLRGSHHPTNQSFMFLLRGISPLARFFNSFYNS